MNIKDFKILLREMTENKYLLFCAQEANFQTRSMLIPYDKFMSQRKKEYENLKENSYFDNDLNGFVYIDKIIGGEQSLTQETRFINEMINICEWDIEFRCYPGDIDWIKGRFSHPCSTGFNHKDNFKKGLAMKEFNGKPIDVVEGVLVLQKFIW